MVMKNVFKVLEVNCNIQSCVDSCVVENLETGEIIHVDEKTADGLRAEIIEKVENYDLVIGDEFKLRT
tara:strand:+ start:564 stop:767 length:204 start_codon:yes stop_codon:yes gene_type:complete